MERGAAACKNHAIDSAEFGIGHVEAAEFRGGFLDRKTTAHGVANAVRLLVDFLEHVVREFSLIHRLGSELDLANLKIRTGSRNRRDLESLSLNGDDLVVV